MAYCAYNDKDASSANPEMSDKLPSSPTNSSYISGLHFDLKPSLDRSLWKTCYVFREGRKGVKMTFQGKVYNFLERPTGWKCFIYHFTVFLVVLVCLIFSVLSTIDQYTDFAIETLFWMETVLVVFFGVEYLIRLWAAGCRSKYMGIWGRLICPKTYIDHAGLKIALITNLEASVSTLNCIVSYMCNMQKFFGGIVVSLGIEVFDFSKFCVCCMLIDKEEHGVSLGSVVFVHRQELITTLYIGFLGLIFSSYFMYLAEKEDVGIIGKSDFTSYADALWWGVLIVCFHLLTFSITVTTIGYGDTVPKTWMGKIVASCFSVFCNIIFCITCRHTSVYGDVMQLINRFLSTATWKIHIKDSEFSNSSNSSTPLSKLLLLSRETGDKGLFFLEFLKLFKKPGRLLKRQIIKKEYKPLSSAAQAQSYQNNDVGSDEIEIDIDDPPMLTVLTEAHKNAIRAIRKIKYFVARRKFQQARKPYDVRDVIEQYSQGHLNMMVRIKELQRRLDHTLGKPGSYLAEKGMKPMTIGARLHRMEQQLGNLDRKMDIVVCTLNMLVEKLTNGSINVEQDI
ncbi:potassium voltage-gated channel subfamily KQT member 1 [Caerostris extrusa]|uniref:Potassium voltage-gated channel subfamily KQT member 1 n=1 Tax=Caerostris extrusa TaxID=172846 RepID=A0AAV4WID3_CAEEX|nr:potassium voltage-gated channel subfamily KQT member 1 [Caerostris extrusa]